MIRDVVTRGFGLGDGTAFIPTLGFTPSTAPVVSAPTRSLWGRAGYTPRLFGRASLGAGMSEFNQFSFSRGDAVDLYFALPEDPSAWSLRFCLLTNQADDPSSALVTLTVSGITATNRLVVVSLSSASTDRTAARYYFTLARTDARGMLAYGVIDIGSADAS